MDKIEELLTRGVANIIPGKEELKKELASGKKLNIYLGIDPTSSKIHLGHAVALRKLQAFADEGHNVTFLIGDFTALIGDTSDKESERPQLTPEEVAHHFKAYQRQAEKIVDFSKVHVRNNSEWLNTLAFKDVLKMCSEIFSLNDFISRELIKKRLEEGTRVGLQELLYPVMQAYDSYKLETDLQIGGTDQTFNIQAGRTLIKRWANKESFVLTTPILEGTDGRKMSKSWGNAIWLNDTPTDIYAKVMAIADSLIVEYFILATNVPLEEIKVIETRLAEGEEHPMKAKKRLAHAIVLELYSQEQADKAAEEFEKVVQKDELPTDIPSISLSEEQLKSTLADMLVFLVLAESKSEAKRLIEQGGVKVGESVIKDPQQTFEALHKEEETLVQVGKRRFVKVKVENKS